MYIHKFLSYFYILFFLVVQNVIFSQVFTINGQASGWLSGNKKSFLSRTGIRYIPDIFIEKSLSDKLYADAEVSINTHLTSDFYDWKSENLTAKIKPYRIWLRLSSNNFEMRAGLQKINFGSAVLFRPLMWFDRTDARDPLKLTDGVYGCLLRYYFQNNSTIWLWVLYDNKDLKGWEIVPTKDNGIEVGGRLQTLILAGETGISFHHRKSDFSGVSFLSSITNKYLVDENRFAFDLKWDIKIGAWFEGTIIHRNTDIYFLKYQRLWTVGTDYTFDIGNGVTFLTEFFNSENSKKIFGPGEGIKFSGSSVSYPVGLLDQISGFYYYDWTNNDPYLLFTWRRTYDNWLFYLISFINPETVRLHQTQTGNNIFAGTGFQIMIVFNH